MQRIRQTIIICLTTLVAMLCGAVPAMAAEGLTPSAASLQLGSTEVHGGSFPQQGVSFVNESEAATNVKAVEVTGSDAANFVIAMDGCSGEVRPGGSCEVQVRLQPQSAGAKSAALTVVDGDGAVEVALTGTGTAGTLSGASPEFPLTVVGRSESTQVTVNNADAGTHIENVEIVGPDASAFSFDYGNCAGNTFSAGNSCNMGLRFSPASPGAKNAQLVITSDAGNTPLVISLDAVAAAGPRLSVDPQQALLGDVAIGSSVQQTFTLTNTGDYPLGVQGAFVVSGTPLMFPVVEETCSQRYLQPGESCAFTIAFKPTALGQKDASIIMITSAENGVSAVGLEGTGVTGGASPSNVPSPTIETPSTTPPALLPAASPVSPAQPLDLRLRLVHLAKTPVTLSVNTGIGAVCPTGVASCRVRAFLTSTVRARRAQRSRRAGVPTPVLLGSSAITLVAGQHRSVRVQLSNGGLALLVRRHRLKASIMVAIAAPGLPTVTQWHSVTLTARGAPVAVG